MSVDPATLLQQAVTLHQQGRLEQAYTLYQQVLARAPQQFDALHLSGVIERQRGNPARAAALIREALQVDPQQARAHANLGAASGWPRSFRAAPGKRWTATSVPSPSSPDIRKPGATAPSC
jgi:tetratricopeptide (TPR) repeat protein